MNSSNQFLFANTHEWIFQAESNLYSVGISNHAQEALGDILFLKLPEIGATVNQGDACANIESLKAASDIHAPISGTIDEINPEAIEKPELINAKPYDIWLFKIRPANQDLAKKEITALLNRTEYEGGINT